MTQFDMDWYESEEEFLADVKERTANANLLVGAAKGDQEAFKKLDMGLQAFVSSYLDDKQRAELAKMQPIDIIDNIYHWEKVGCEELQDIYDAQDAGYAVPSPSVSAPDNAPAWRPK
ncbi:hypothetical protein [Pleomorphomonas oryzae]|uniref:hypothetical protein n=1 Tax=Pleomorphomonas oryzae TaxID=261934 RepID=UPI00047C77B1|nr:hypothetical protein [Pleomorphomonas oryzae]